MNKQDILHLFNKYYGDRYEAYISSIKSEKKNYFFLVKDDYSKYLIVIGDTHGICKDFEGEAKVMEPDEITEWGWFDFDDLPEKVFPPALKIIKNYLDKTIYKH